MLICKNCEKSFDELAVKIKKDFLPNGGYHLKAYCPECNIFIKNIPHSMPKVLHFGKYKGKPIAVVAKENTSYLRWLCNQDIKNNLKQSILDELEAIDNESLQQCFKLS